MMKLIVPLLILLNYLFQIIATYYFYQTVGCFVPVKNNRILKALVGCTMFIIVLIVIQPQDVANVLGVSLLFILTLFIGFNGTIIRKISTIAILLPLVITSNFLLEEIGVYIFFMTRQGEILDALLHLIFAGIKSVIWYGVYRGFKQKITNAKKMLNSSAWGMISLICLGPLVGIIFIVIFSPDTIWLTFPVMGATALTSFSIQYLTGYLSDAFKKEMENKNLKMQEAYYLEVEKNQQEIRKLKHDLNNHLSVVGTYLEDNQVEEAKAYFTELSTVYANQRREFCKNPLVNNVLNVKYQLAQEYGIDCFINIDISNVIGIDDVSLCTVLANTLDNAIEACLKIEEPSQRKLTVKARYHRGCFSYEITNTISAAASNSTELLLTTKTDKKNHGFGLANIREIVDNYEGTIEIKQSEHQFSLLLVIMDV
ncbi:sensor histidine kinase [Enterococcus sp. AZ072]|uniref:sensor histidine kinase n=1 Tax=unclassified Enterococcus TaxID=2608891 RepID=UPI003D2E4127